jgi:hypothetical protein
MAYPPIDLISDLFICNFGDKMQCQGDIGEGLIVQDDIVHEWNQTKNCKNLTFKSLTNTNFILNISSNGNIAGKGILFIPDYYIYSYEMMLDDNESLLRIRDINNPGFYLEIIFFK